MEINGRPIAQGYRPYIIAEIGQAHHGSVAQAHALIQIAKECGVDAVKFQHHIPQEERPDRREYWQEVGLTLQEWASIRRAAQDFRLGFIVSCFSLKSIELMRPLKPHAWKIPSAPFWLERLQLCAEDGTPLIISTGMSTMEEIARMAENPIHPIALMQCTSIYPTPLDKVGLSYVRILHERWKVPVGLSDHSGTIWPSVAAMAQGAPLIEVHLMHEVDYPDRTPDAPASLLRSQLAQICEARDAINIMQHDHQHKDVIATELAETRKKYGHDTRQTYQSVLG